MASTSKCSPPTKEVGVLDTMVGVGAAASDIDHATMSSMDSCVERENIVEVERRKDVSIEEEIERSKTHWSMLAEFGGEKVEPLQPWGKWKKFMLCCSNVDDEEVAEVSNVKEFRALQSHPTWGSFFGTFGYDLLGGQYIRNGELVMGKKFAEGGQAELYDCKVKWWYSKGNDGGVRHGKEYVLKVFKKGTFLKHLKSLLPQGLLQFHVVIMKNYESPTPIERPRFFCRVLRGILLKDGRFAFLMEKEHFDLRHLINDKMKGRSGMYCGPFLKEEVELIMFWVALGVEWLHRQDIVHRDLKASNVLVWERKSGWLKWECFVADYECSGGVVGTGFFRAPEILQACKERKLREWPEVFSKEADIYGYGMICYEVLTGKLPFEGRSWNDYNHVLRGHRPLVPKHVEDWIRDLLNRCWQLDPATRPCIGDILSVILAHSEEARRVDAWIEEDYGKDYRLGYDA